MNKTFDLLTLGELLLRLSPNNNERIARTELLQVRAGGAELNVASGVSLLGLRTGVISKVPDNDLGRNIKNRIRFCGVSDDFLVYDKDKYARMGIYYYENGAHPRKPRIVYDRCNTSMDKISIDDFDDSIYSSTRCFHTSGITLGLCEQVRETAIEMIKRFKANGTIISFDVNYRANLWRDEAEARDCITQILPYVDIFFCSEETSRLTFGKEGTVEDIMRSFAAEYPMMMIASTQRIVHSPKVHTFGSIVYDCRGDKFYQEEPYHNIEVVDRIGSGDAYISGVLYGLLVSDFDYRIDIGIAHV